VICARIEVPVRVTASARTRATPSKMMLSPPVGTLTICRMIATVPMRRTSSGSGSSSSFSWSSSSTIRSAPSERLTVSIETGRVTASGCRVSGKATVRRSGRTGSSGGSCGGVSSANVQAFYQQLVVRFRRG
jgi:hypothetical protein